MRVLLTGITGNLGYEIAQCLKRHKIDVLPVVRNPYSLDRLDLPVKETIEADLTRDTLKIDSGKVDCIIHSAGNVHFKKSRDSNSTMMQSVIRAARDLEVPIYYVSTAFLWRESGNIEKPRNAYEIDKCNAEKMLRDSGLPNTVLRPSVLVGNSDSGKLINWTGYYMLTSKFLEATKVTTNTKIRFPLLTGTANMIPINQAAEVVSEAVLSNTLNSLVYVTNPEPPRAQWILDTTLNFFGLRERFEFIDRDFAGYKGLERTKEEEVLYLAGKHFSSYWSLTYNFPESAVKENLITEEYLKKTLKSFQHSNNISAV